MLKSAGQPKEIKVDAFSCFVRACQEEHRKLFPNEALPSFHVVSLKCAQKWQQMTEVEKSRFQAVADADAKRYAEEKAYFSSLGHSFAGADPSKRAKKAMKDPNKPKKPTSAFFYFANEKREEVKAANPQWKITEISRELGRLWKEASAEEKRRYEEMYDRDKIRFEKEMAQYNGGGGIVRKNGGEELGAASTSAVGDDVEKEPAMEVKQADQDLSEPQAD